MIHTGNYTSSGLRIRKPSFEAGIFLSTREIRRILAYGFHYQHWTDESMPYFFWLYSQDGHLIQLQEYLQLMNQYFDELSKNLSEYFSLMSADVVEFTDFDLLGGCREYFLYLQCLINQLHGKLRSLQLTLTAERLYDLLAYIEREPLEYGTDEPENEESGFGRYCERIQMRFEEIARSLERERVSLLEKE